MSKVIQLTKGYSTIVDDEDYDFLMQWKWYAREHRKTCYATRSQSVEEFRGSGRKQEHMHRAILGLTTKDMDKIVDHINHNGLDNRKSNLRICNADQNAWNMLKHRGSSKYKGVFRLADNRWGSVITYKKAKIRLGAFDNEEDAALAYDAEAIKLFGEFANINLPQVQAAIGGKDETK